jgi:hypothetical protein
MLAKVMDTMGLAVAVIGLFVSFIGDGQFTKYRLATIFDGLMMLVLKLSVKCISSLLALFQHHKIVTGKGPHIRNLEGLV